MSSQSTDTRTRALNATIRMLEDHGGRGVRMGDIAKEAGISRQALYLHFSSRTDLLVAATRHLDDKLDLDKRLSPSRTAASGVDRLNRYIEFWGSYVPEIYGVAKALMLAQDSDEAAAAAWKGRMEAMRDGCRAAIDALHAEGNLVHGWSKKKATDALWTLLLVPGWEALTIDCGWSAKDYVRWTKTQAQLTFVKGANQ